MTNWSLTILLLHLWSLFLITVYFYDFQNTGLFKKIFEKKETNDEIIVQQQQALNVTNNETNNNGVVECVILKTERNLPIFVSFIEFSVIIDLFFNFKIYRLSA